MLALKLISFRVKIVKIKKRIIFMKSGALVKENREVLT
jgi:hypothetical protein